MHLPHIDDFLLNLQTNNYSPETIYNYERDLKVFGDFLEDADVPFPRVDKLMLLNYKAYLISRDRKTPKSEKAPKRLSSFSMNRMLSSLRSYLKFLIEMDYPSPVAPDMVKLSKTERKHLRVSEFDDVLRLIESPQKLEKNETVASRNRAMLETLFSTGMRISELLSLKISQINDTGRVFIRGKGKKERFVYLTPRAKRQIKAYMEIRGPHPSPYIFIPYRGKNVGKKEKRISPNYLEERVKKYRELLRLNVPITVHGIRHAFATYMAESGANPAALQILLGHASLDTTKGYVHGSDRYAERTFKKFHPLKE